MGHFQHQCNNAYKLQYTYTISPRDGVLEDWPRPRGQNFVALALASKTFGLGLDDARPWLWLQDLAVSR